MTRIALALGLLLGVACDLEPCSPAVVSIHEARCAAGDPDACAALHSCDQGACDGLPGCAP